MRDLLILTEITRAVSVTSAAGLQLTLVGDALRFIERHCLLPISLREVAAAVRKSPSYVATVVKASTGKTVGPTAPPRRRGGRASALQATA